jgi:aspartate/methionine/tyrosine aminotransferase
MDHCETIPLKTFNKVSEEVGIKVFSKAQYWQINRFIESVEKNIPFEWIRLDVGISTFGVPKEGIKGEMDFFQNHPYLLEKKPPLNGTDDLKKEMIKFAGTYMKIRRSDIDFIPTVGSIQASFAIFLMISRLGMARNKTLFLDPAFAMHKQQHKILNLPYESVDFYDVRKLGLIKALDNFLKTCEFSTIVYSSPNNPSWMSLNTDELKTIGELANKYNLIVIEDKSYFSFDDEKSAGRNDDRTISKFTNDYMILFSSSKLFSYAGQRIGGILISKNLYNKYFPGMEKTFNSLIFGEALLYEILNTISSGVSISAQFGLTSILRSCNEGKFDLDQRKLFYQKKSRFLKKLFAKHGFKIMYEEQTMRNRKADGFFFALYYPEHSIETVMKVLLILGIGITAFETSSNYKEKMGLRICVSQFQENSLPLLESRLVHFNKIMKSMHYKAFEYIS